MRSSLLVALSISMVAVVACPKDQAKTDTTAEPAKTAATSQPSGTVATSQPTGTSGTPAAGDSAMAGNRKMANCPSTVAGAMTKVDDAPDAVVVTVTGTGDAVTEIRARSKHLAEVSAKAPAEVKHTGEGVGGGGLGNCPVVLADTTITSEEVEGGAKLTIKPANAADLGKLKALAKERHAKMAAPK
jgi:hypothetical protein